VTVDKPTINTELKSTSMVTVSFQASGGFSGPVNLTASVVDAANAPLTGWTVALDSSTVNLAADGSATAVATLTIPSENRGLAGTIKIDATSSLGTVNLTSTVTVQNQVTIPVSLNNNQCVYPPAGTIQMTVGSKIRFLNTATDDNITIHVDNGGNANTAPGVPHQSDPGSAPGTAYERTITGLAGGDGTFSWYCHAPGPNVGGLKIRPVAAQ
jgi:plastocyanin